MKPLAFAVAALFAVGTAGVHAETAKPEAQTADAAPAAASTANSDDTIEDWLIIRDTTYIPVVDDVSRKLAAARTAFLAKDAKAAATDLREAVNLLASRQAKASAADRKALTRARSGLSGLAAALEAGKVKSAQQFDAAYAKAMRADVVLRSAVVDESVWVALTPEPERHFSAAAEAFANQEYERAAEEIRKGEALVELESTRTTKAGRNALGAAATELRKLAASVEKGSIKDGKVLTAVFARADHALALAHRESAAASWAQKQTKRAGTELKAAALDTEHAAAWVGGKVQAGAAAAAGDARALGEKLESGATWTRDELAKGFESLGNVINALGEKVGSSQKVSPLNSGA